MKRRSNKTKGLKRLRIDYKQRVSAIVDLVINKKYKPRNKRRLMGIFNALKKGYNIKPKNRQYVNRIFYKKYPKPKPKNKVELKLVKKYECIKRLKDNPDYAKMSMFLRISSLKEFDKSKAYNEVVRLLRGDWSKTLDNQPWECEYRFIPIEVVPRDLLDNKIHYMLFIKKRGKVYEYRGVIE